MKKSLRIMLLMVTILAACGQSPQSTPPGNGIVPSASAPAINPSSTSTTTVPLPASATETNSAIPPSQNPASCIDTAAFVQDVTVQDNERFLPGQKFDKIWRVRNSGTCTWTADHTLVFSNGNRMNAPAESKLKDTAPGSTLDIKVSMAAPNDESVTHARADFEIRDPSGNAIPIDSGTTLWVVIQVAGANALKNDPMDNTGPGYANATCNYTTNPAKVNEVIAALNAYRAQQGLAPFTLNARLTEAAQAHSADMACNQLFYHNGSNGSTAISRVVAAGYIASAVTENVYGSYPPLSGQEVINWWANDVADPRHNENLLSTRYLEIGVAYAYYNNYGYFVIDFAVP